MRNSIQAIRRLRWADMTRREVLVATVFATGSRAAGFASGALDLDFVSALDAAAAIRNKRVSSVELTERMLARIERYNRSEEHTSELQSLRHLVCRLLL